MGTDYVIEVESLWKRYGLPLAWARESSFRAHSPTKGGGAGRGEWALADVSFGVKRGETLGIIGRNGAGKSTLLKVLCGVTPPTQGRVTTSGRIFPMLELNAGVHPELTGRENARLLAAVVGLDRREAEACLPEIEAFCELGEWFDRPVRKYSSGMLARLGFSVAMHVNAEILLIDEVLAVGDFAFQKKCIAILADRTRRGTTAVLVSHNPYLVERMCDRVLLLNEGTPEELGNPSEVIPRYFQMGLADLKAGETLQDSGAERPGTGEVRVERLELLAGDSSSVEELETGRPATFRIHYRAKNRVREPNFSLRVYDAQNTIVLSFTSTQDRQGWEVEGDGFVDCQVDRLPLMPNVYLAQIKIAAEVTYDVCEVAGRFVVKAGSRELVSSGNVGIAYVDARWTLG